jgi:tetraacyldisaccharide 4'-kinase
MVKGYPSWWRGIAAPTLLLLPLSALFALAAAARRALYARGVLKRERLPVPVIVVGNIAAGGAGKTPLTVWLAHALTARGYRPGVLARGVGGAARAPRAVDAHSDPAQVGDEPVLLARRCAAPVWVGRDRPAAGRALLAAHPEVDVLLCDDGLQHYRLARDAEIVVVDGARGLGNGLPLPAGPLREHASRLRGVCAVVINGGGQDELRRDLDVPALDMHLLPVRLRNLARPEQVVEPGRFKAREVHAAAGIADPERFFRTLEALGMHVSRHPFPDHHAFRREDLPFVGTLAMTEKDGVKCAAFASEDWWQLEVEAQVPDALTERLLACLDARGRAGRSSGPTDESVDAE